MIRPPPRSTLFPTRRSSDLGETLKRSYPIVKKGGILVGLVGRVDQGELDKYGIRGQPEDRKSTRLNSSHVEISYAVFCLKKKTGKETSRRERSYCRRDGCHD